MSASASAPALRHPEVCCTGLQQINAIEAELVAQVTCRCLRQNSIFSNPQSISLNVATLHGLQAGCSVAVGANISIDLSCLLI
ncbi:Quinolinate synthase [Psidium guajava]|nr:Quinolinate synthase [Psidium guajava]